MLLIRLPMRSGRWRKRWGISVLLQDAGQFHWLPLYIQTWLKGVWQVWPSAEKLNPEENKHPCVCQRKRQLGMWFKLVKKKNTSIHQFWLRTSRLWGQQSHCSAALCCSTTWDISCVPVACQDQRWGVFSQLGGCPGGILFRLLDQVLFSRQHCSPDMCYVPQIYCLCDIYIFA